MEVAAGAGPRPTNNKSHAQSTHDTGEEYIELAAGALAGPRPTKFEPEPPLYYPGGYLTVVP